MSNADFFDNDLLRSMEAADRSRIPTLPRTLYRFRAIANDLYRRRELEQVAGSPNLVFLSSPNNFNDAYDCKPFILPNTRMDILEFTGQCIARGFMTPKTDMGIMGMRNASTTLTEDAFQDWLLKFCYNVFDGFEYVSRVGCFTDRCDSSAMWYHYANNYSGVCFRFDLPDQIDGRDAGLIFSRSDRRLRHVNYANERPSVDCLAVIRSLLTGISAAIALSSQHLLRDLINKVYFTKSSDWSYEREYRILSDLRSDYVSIEPYRITEVILGPNAPDVISDEVREIFLPLGVKILRASFSRSNFGLHPVLPDPA